MLLASLLPGQDSPCSAFLLVAGAGDDLQLRAVGLFLVPREQVPAAPWCGLLWGVSCCRRVPRGTAPAQGMCVLLCWEQVEHWRSGKRGE